MVSGQLFPPIKLTLLNFIVMAFETTFSTRMNIFEATHYDFFASSARPS